MSASENKNAAVRFGTFIRTRRLELGITAREVATAIGFQASNFSSLEHGVILPPKDSGKLTKLAEALNLKTAPQRRMLFDLAAKATNSIPADIEEIITAQEAVPLLLRTIGNRKLSQADLQKIVRIVHGKQP